MTAQVYESNQDGPCGPPMVLFPAPLCIVSQQDQAPSCHLGLKSDGEDGTTQQCTDVNLGARPPVRLHTENRVIAVLCAHFTFPLRNAEWPKVQGPEDNSLPESPHEVTVRSTTVGSQTGSAVLSWSRRSQSTEYSGCCHLEHRDTCVTSYGNMLGSQN